ncbi:MDR family MFS transporter [Effusibacillus pohliae]|uniref:MDR family MFS transporter n=1 Tax=Effusibacillus pohliae TaxID=232270 RepID=UPI000375251D|nr:MFS transporter [Effusibacillus pohliae]
MQSMLHQADQLRARIAGWYSSIPAVVWILFTGGLLNSIGNSFLWPLNSLYIHTVLGKSMTTAGIVLMLMNGAGILGNLAGGALFDRIGGKWVILVGLLGSAVWVTALGFTHSFPLYVALMITLGFTQSMVWPSFHALIGQLWPSGGRRAFNMFYVVNNLGVAIGTAIGGFLAEISFLLVFLLNGLSYSLYAAIFLYALRRHRVPEESDSLDPASALPENQPAAVTQTAVSIAAPVALLSIGILIAWTAYSQWAGPLAVYTQQAGYPLSSYSFLWTLNGILIVAGQPFLTPLLSRFLRSLTLQLITGGLLYVATFVLIAGFPVYTGFVLGMAVMTIGEMIILPGVPAAINRLAPKERMGFYQGITASAATAGRMLGPVLGGMVFDHAGAIRLFLLAAIACLAATACFVGFHLSSKKCPAE